MMEFLAIFLSGMTATGVLIWICKECIRKIERRKDKKRLIVQSEKDGWIKTDGFTHWSSRRGMIKWRKKIKDDLEMSIWLEENTKDYFTAEYIYGTRYIKFDKEEDGVAFKLRWC